MDLLKFKNLFFGINRKSRLSEVKEYSSIRYFFIIQLIKNEYSRYDHSIDVFAILRKNNFSLTEQIAGLLHDVSHVGAWVFNKENQENDYQNEILSF